MARFTTSLVCFHSKTVSLLERPRCIDKHVTCHNAWRSLVSDYLSYREAFCNNISFGLAVGGALLVHFCCGRKLKKIYTLSTQALLTKLTLVLIYSSKVSI